MHRAHAIVATLAAGALVCSTLAAAQVSDTVALADLSIRGLGHGSDTTATRSVLGPPLRVHRHDKPNEDGVLLTDWFYPDLVLSFDPSGHRYMAVIRGSRYRTTRGIAVGDSATRVQTAYGGPLQRDRSAPLGYAVSTSDSETRGITFFIKNGVVHEIVIGNVISVE